MAKSEKGASHEDFSKANEVKVGSDRSFGFVFTAVFAIIGLWPLVNGGAIRPWALGGAAAILLISLVRPQTLRPFNLLWFKFGQLLHKITNPLIMGFLFYLTITPMALIMRMLGKDPLKRKLDPAAETYWIDRDPPGPAPDSLKNQF